MWLAVRAVGHREAAGARPGQQPLRGRAQRAIYVIVDDQPSWKTSAVPQLVKEQRQILQELADRARRSDGRSRGVGNGGRARVPMGAAALPARPRVEEADAKYQESPEASDWQPVSVAMRGFEGVGLAGLSRAAFPGPAAHPPARAFTDTSLNETHGGSRMAPHETTPDPDIGCGVPTCRRPPK